MRLSTFAAAALATITVGMVGVTIFDEQVMTTAQAQSAGLTDTVHVESAPVSPTVSTKRTPSPTVAPTSPFEAKGAAAEQLEDVLEAIESVHALPADMPSLTVRTKVMEKYQGYYKPSSDGQGGFTHLIRIDPQDGNDLVLVHELGHYFDNISWGVTLTTTPGMTPAARKIVRAIERSESAKTLATCAADKKAHATDWCSYAASDHELFARGYSQYVATESGDAEMLADLKSSNPLETWTTKDFAPIAKAFRAFFAQ